MHALLSPQAWFAAGYQTVTGTPAAEFRFVAGVTPFSTYRTVGLMCMVYLVVIFGGQQLMQGRKPIQLATLFRVHNAFLTLVSLGLWLVALEHVVPLVVGDGLVSAFCAKESFTQPLELVYYVNYLTKYYELLDTCFLVLRKKKLEFLHWYHHAMTALLAYTQLSGRTSLSWVPIVLNLGVHVIMYFYYFLATFGIRCWWKKYITVTQIAQFVADLAVIGYILFTNIVVHGGDSWAPGACAGDLSAIVVAAAILGSYLLLFLEFFARIYAKPAAKQVAKPKDQ